MRPGPLHFTGEAPVRPSATRVLLVEDNAGDVELARARLSDVPGHEFVVSHVATLTGALDALIDGVDGFDIVIVDLDLPDARGLDTLVRVRAVAGDVPVVVFTGRREAALFEQLYAAGADDVLNKDEPASRLLARTVVYSLERLRAEARRRRIEQLVLDSPDGVLVTNIVGILIILVMVVGGRVVAAARGAELCVFGSRARLGHIESDQAATRFGFDPQPRPAPGQPDC